MSPPAPAPAPNAVCPAPLSTGQVIGLSFITEAGFMSLCALFILLAYVLRNVLQQRKSPIQSHVDAYMLSLIMADLVQAFGAILNMRWAIEGRVACGTYCSVQGAMKQIGESGVAMSTLAITIHTFLSIFWRWVPPRSKLIPMIIISCIWLYNVLFVIIGTAVHKAADPGGAFYKPAPFWCWIQDDLGERLAGEYLWLWTAALLNITLYLPLYLRLRGFIAADPQRPWVIHFNISGKADDRISSWRLDSSGALREMQCRREAMKMLWYPFAYTVLVLPLSITRWAVLDRTYTVPTAQIPFAASGISLFIFGLSGLVNVLLFRFTRPNILLFGTQAGAGEGRSVGARAGGAGGGHERGGSGNGGSGGSGGSGSGVGSASPRASNIDSKRADLELDLDFDDDEDVGVMERPGSRRRTRSHSHPHPLSFSQSYQPGLRGAHGVKAMRVEMGEMREMGEVGKGGKTTEDGSKAHIHKAPTSSTPPTAPLRLSGAPNAAIQVPPQAAFASLSPQTYSHTQTQTRSLPLPPSLSPSQSVPAFPKPNTSPHPSPNLNLNRSSLPAQPAPTVADTSPHSRVRAGWPDA